MQKAIPAFGFILAVLFLMQTVLAGEITVTLTDDVGVYVRRQDLSGTVSIMYSKYIPRDSDLRAFIDNVPVSMISLHDNEDLHEPIWYDFVEQDFDYNITAYGTNTWAEYPEQYFDYNVTVSGTCGGSYCGGGQRACKCEYYCDPTYPYSCDWSVFFPSSIYEWVKGNEGLESIKNMSILGIPDDQNNDTVWSVTNTNEHVKTTMRAACGEQIYDTYPVSDDGWVRQQITDFTLVSGTRYRAQMPPFDHHSLDQYRDLYIIDESVGLGGIDRILRGQRDYMSYVSECPASPNGTQVIWNGTTGNITICIYDSAAIYIINFLPPNGPMLCAYTPFSISGSEEWSKSATIQNKHCEYFKPDTRNYTADELKGYPYYLTPPSCPPDIGDCERVINDYEVIEVSDPGDSVSITFEADTKTVNVTATTLSTDISRSYTAEEDLSSFSDLRAPSTGNHTLTIKLTHDSSVLATGSMSFVTCNDNDGDGFCGSDEGGNDCNDSDKDVHPGVNEICNGKDDDCDGICWEGGRHNLTCISDSECPEGKCRRIDEDFYGEGMLGEACGVGECADGYYVCTGNGTDVECSKKPEREICENGIDDDCDRYTDELYEYIKDSEILAIEFADGSRVTLKSGWESGERKDACRWCVEGDIKKCGSDIGRCRAGYHVCQNSIWSECLGGYIPPEDETCNRIDDDCNGIVDDVGWGNSRETTQCGCFEGAAPTPEICNDIDDDCDGQIDEDIVCCTPADTRSCGEGGFTGECAKGIQTCTAQGRWKGCSIQPVSEMCYNNLDDNCNGEVDEGCAPEITCYNRVQDPNEEGIDCGGPCPKKCYTFHLWMIVAGIVILIILAVWILVLKKKI